MAQAPVTPMSQYANHTISTAPALALSAETDMDPRETYLPPPTIPTKTDVNIPDKGMLSRSNSVLVSDID